MPVPDLSQIRKTVPIFKLKIHDFDAEDFVPNGDRYVIEQIDFDEEVEFGQILVVSGAGENTSKPWEPKGAQVEARGVFAGVVVSAGNGHLLGLPDWPERSHVNPSGFDIPAQPRSRAEVPMFFKPGDVVLVDYNAKGRNMRIVGRSLRIVSQYDILTSIPKVRLQRVNGEWIQQSTEGDE